MPAGHASARVVMTQRWSPTLIPFQRMPPPDPRAHVDPLDLHQLEHHYCAAVQKSCQKSLPKESAKRVTRCRISLCIVSEKGCRCRRSCLSSVRDRSKYRLAKKGLNRRKKRPKGTSCGGNLAKKV
eukprot:365689-Amphidinium_carterae.1